MKTLLSRLLLVTALASAPTAAQAGLGVDLSIGKGVQTSPSSHAEQLNLMVAPGLTLMNVLRLQLGIANELPDTQNSRYNLELRPMISLVDPTFPLYGRIVFGITNLIHGDSTVAFGAVGGLKMRVGQSINLFFELGVLPRSRHDTLSWVFEGRLGTSIGF
jgi:hypothetical protein